MLAGNDLAKRFRAGIDGGWSPIATERLLTGLAVAWAVTLFVVPAVLRPHASSSVPSYLAARAVYLVGSVICHQRPDRSFFVGGGQMPVCARCAGIYLGAAMALSVMAVTGNRRSWSTQVNVTMCGISAIPSLATLVYELMTGVTPSNIVRAAAGVPFGIAVAWIVARAITVRSPVELH